MEIEMILIMGLLCYTAHSIDDYVLQGCRCDLKQKSFWTKYGREYEHDWIPALISHSVEWSVVTALPVIAYCLYAGSMPWQIIAVVIANAIIHFKIDTMKCNEFKINLCIDQFAHLMQIVVLVAVWAICM